MRLLGAVAPPSPSAEDGMRLGKASAAPATEACRRKPRRVGAETDERGGADRGAGGGMRQGFVDEGLEEKTRNADSRPPMQSSVRTSRPEG